MNSIEGVSLTMHDVDSRNKIEDKSSATLILERWQTYFTTLMNEENPGEAWEEEQEENLKEMEVITAGTVKRAL